MVARKSKPLPNYQKIVLNHTEACQQITLLRQIEISIKHYDIIRW